MRARTGRTRRAVVARLSTTLLVADAGAAGAGFDAADLCAWARLGPKGFRDVGIGRGGWDVALGKARLGWRVGLAWSGGGGKREGLDLVFGDEDEARAWYEVLLGSVRAWGEEGVCGEGGGKEGRRETVVRKGTRELPKAAVGMLLKTRFPKTPHMMLAQFALSKAGGYLYKQRFGVKSYLVRTPAERAYAALHGVRIVLLREMVEAGSVVVELVDGVVEVEETLRKCDRFLVGSSGFVTGFVSTPKVFQEAEEVAERLRKESGLVQDKWDQSSVGEVHDLLRSSTAR